MNEIVLDDENPQNNAVTAAVAVKLPDFWKNDPTMWFAQAEAQFALAGVVQDETKYFHIIIRQVCLIVAYSPIESGRPFESNLKVDKFHLAYLNLTVQ